jgi:ABC-type cobalamin/Fe3+-siderophores transport system ATPase subunit
MTLEMRDLDFAYSDSSRALREVTLSFKDGQLVALTGPNGSGKSTLLKIAARVLPPTRGMVLFAGR